MKIYFFYRNFFFENVDVGALCKISTHSFELLNTYYKNNDP